MQHSGMQKCGDLGSASPVSTFTGGLHMVAGLKKIGT